MQMFDRAVRVTHIPTGESITLTNEFHRLMHQMHKDAETIIHSRLYAIQHGIVRSTKEVAVYDLPNDEPFPHELKKYQVRT